MIIPVGKRLVIKPVDPKQGKILLTHQKPSSFIVLAVGDEVTKVQPGNTVFMEKHYGVEVEHDDEKFLVVDEDSILAKLDSKLNLPVR